MITFLINISCIVAEILAYISVFILAYKIPRLFLNHYAKKHNMTLDELLNENDIFGHLSYNLNCLDGFLILIFVANVMTVFITLGDLSLSELLAGLVFGNSTVLIVMAIGFFADLNDCLKHIIEYLRKNELLKKSIKF